MSNQVEAKKPTFAEIIAGKYYRGFISSTLRDPNKANRFVAAITSAVSTNPALQECDAPTIVSAGLLGESLNLSPSPQLGQYYIVPFNDTKNCRKVGTFQLGYKGYIQLAIRSGYYKKLNVLPIKEGELVSFDPLEEILEVNLIQDEATREDAPTIGYYAMFEYHNGFRKAMYWSRQKMTAHAEKFSKGYKAHKGYTFWEKDFDSMACKTMLRQLISKWGIMSIDLQEAFTKDNTLINEDGTYEYVDNDDDAPIVPQPEPDVIPAEMTENEVTMNDL